MKSKQMHTPVMETILEKPWSYKLYKSDSDLILSVIVGGAAMYDLNIRLNAEEKRSYEKDGESYIERLAAEVTEHPSKFRERHVKL